MNAQMRQNPGDSKLANEARVKRTQINTSERNAQLLRWYACMF